MPAPHHAAVVTPLTTDSSTEELALEQAPPVAGRILNRRTLLSITAALIIVAVAIWRAPINWSEAWSNIRRADLSLYLVALAVFYSSFLVRGLRWQVLLANTGAKRRTRDLVPIIVTSFFINCVVPAKMGDLYRAYLGRVKERLSGTMALGTILAERLLDLCVLIGLLVVAGAYVFQRHASGALIPYMIGGTVVCAGGITIIALMRAGRGKRLLRLLPEAIFDKYESFRIGAVTSLRRWPLLITLTVLVWALEAGRLGFVVTALGYNSQVGPSQFLLIALVAALLTTVPFLPGGIGLVEAGMVGVLVAVGGVDRNAALSIALLDRSISYGSLVALGFIVFAVTHVHVPRHRAVAPPEPGG